MKAVVQRVKWARVTVVKEGVREQVGAVGPGLLVLLGVGVGDTAEDVRYLAQKVAGLRIFPDAAGKMNLCLGEWLAARDGPAGTDEPAEPGVLAVSQFTLYGDVRKGKRPSYAQAAPPGAARMLYEEFVEALRSQGVHVETGRFQAEMDVELCNWGPVTILLESPAGTRT